MDKEISIKQFISAIQQLPPDKPQNNPGKWYKTQKEHWLGWLSEYDGPGAYVRKAEIKRDAKYAYNHIVEYRMLLWLIKAAKVNPDLIKAARSACDRAGTLQGKSAAIRNYVPWEQVTARIWKNK